MSETLEMRTCHICGHKYKANNYKNHLKTDEHKRRMDQLIAERIVKG